MVHEFKGEQRMFSPYALHASRAAGEESIVPGGGVAYFVRLVFWI